MVKNPEILESFERKQVQKEKLNYLRSLRIFEALWKEAVSMGVLPLKAPLEGIETDIRIAQIINSPNV